MNITTHNYHDVVKLINWGTIPGSLVRMSKEIIPNASSDEWAIYKNDPDVARVVDKYFGYLTIQAKKQGLVEPPAPPRGPAPKKAPAKKVAKPPAAKAAKPAKAKKEVVVKEAPHQGKPVEHIACTVGFVKRYVALNGKIKSAEDLARLLHGVQKAILEKRITKGSSWAAEVDHMQTTLVKAIKEMDAEGSIRVEIKPVLLKRYQEIATSESAMPSVRLLKQYIAITGKRGVKEKSRKLRAAIYKAVDTGKITESDKYEAHLDAAYRSLCIFLDEPKGVSTSLELHPYELGALSGITGHAATSGHGDLSGIHSKASSLFSSKKHHTTIGKKKRYSPKVK